MTPAQTIPAVLMHYDATGVLIVEPPTGTAEYMCSAVDVAAETLRGRKPVLVVEGDVDAVLKALGIWTEQAQA